MTDERPRYTALALPPYSYVPGHAPHPVSDPAGHMHGSEHEPAEPLQPEAWDESAEYLYAIDLFNHGYYWEAHEAWESLWLSAGRTGRVGSFLKGLIKLAAAGVKAREGNPTGVSRHAKRAKELLSGERSAKFCGLNVAKTTGFAEQLLDEAESYSQPQPELLLGIWLRPR